jgi:hypothetical protein
MARLKDIGFERSWRRRLLRQDTREQNGVRSKTGDMARLCVNNALCSPFCLCPP